MSLKKHFFLFSIILLFIGCKPQDPLSNAFYFSDSWLINDVVAPEYPFDNANEKNPIKISFTKQGQYELMLKLQTCNGSYEANEDGSIQFTRNNCSVSCCESEWDYYVVTLIKKSTSYITENNSKIYLHIDDANYLVLETDKSTS